MNTLKDHCLNINELRFHVCRATVSHSRNMQTHRSQAERKNNKPHYSIQGQHWHLQSPFSSEQSPHCKLCPKLNPIWWFFSQKYYHTLKSWVLHAAASTALFQVKGTFKHHLLSLQCEFEDGLYTAWMGKLAQVRKNNWWNVVVVKRSQVQSRLTARKWYHQQTGFTKGLVDYNHSPLPH